MIVDETVDYHLRSTLFTMRRMYNLMAQEFGITQGIGYALINIGEEGIPATKIAPLMGMTSSSLSRMLKNMEDNGYIFRKQDLEDRRVVRIFLSFDGRALKKKIEDVVLDFNTKLLKRLSKNEIKAFEKVNSIIKEEAKSEIEKLKLTQP
ncbi:MAG: MarR family transcriptional regulator [Lentimicrobiaceae bacterium]|jgi:MarR family transcriptional regulator, organic hydroperoxide resistance regulator|nr:MarR family transcriptional regulator [Lentimicrobiaceae bacterium]MCP4910505.1 MarR family transcriptional regulator [Bacteroidota bacterium]MBT3455359.1 MarR family transcriptional regulator [Lentimicrobiaceae bacterium]MBT3818801.1 MarR family transcriptional regulator [Lentimicrobiaceae bacterium]MBT4062068.1 MarR family transcriptional regulator [Lentimicrobiaceae bacterium]